ncbi:dTDP-glucose 4,6-dehydratase [Cardinium endosymbiont of Tipula unca]|uniref:dTDP-glucose 4,6-dehydratase n=1 Tax=Cardinium endosymbiont of Tipula unca TaxID=3066216 RepID=UPI0030D40F74
MQKLLVTGGAGFIGSHLIHLFLKQHPQYFIVNLDKLTYAANRYFLQELNNNPNHHFVEGDVTDFSLVSKLFEEFEFDGVIHLAAESHVDRSISDPLLFVKTNIEGTGVLLHAAYLHWLNKSDQATPAFKRFLYISTDEVCGPLDNDTVLFTEHSPINPKNPYSSSKAAGECLVHSYIHTYKLNAIITRSTNNYGPRQHPEKLIPMVLKHALEQRPILLHGDGSSIRDWLHVEDHCRAIDCIFHNGQHGACYNIGANEERTNLEIASMICTILDSLQPLKKHTYNAFISFIAERLGQDRRYGLNYTKLRETLGWKPSITLQKGIEHLVYSQITKLNDC